MERYLLLFAFIILLPRDSMSQTLYYDAKRVAAMQAGYAMRNLVEARLKSETDNINKNMESINESLAKVVATRLLIHNSLRNVSSALRNGKQVMYMGKLIQEIIKECSGLIEDVKTAPQYALFAEESTRETITYTTLVSTEVYNIILKEGNGLLMNYSKRDALIQEITHKLMILRSYITVIRQSVYYAKMMGLFHSLMPYSEFVSRDISIINDIKFKLQLLKN